MQFSTLRARHVLAMARNVVDWNIFMKILSSFLFLHAHLCGSQMKNEDLEQLRLLTARELVQFILLSFSFSFPVLAKIQCHLDMT